MFYEGIFITKDSLITTEKHEGVHLNNATKWGYMAIKINGLWFHRYEKDKGITLTDEQGFCSRFPIGSGNEEEMIVFLKRFFSSDSGK